MRTRRPRRPVERRTTHERLAGIQGLAGRRSQRLAALLLARAAFPRGRGGILAGATVGWDWTMATLRWVTRKEPVPWTAAVAVDGKCRVTNFPNRLGPYELVGDGVFDKVPDGRPDGDVVLTADVLESLKINTALDQMRLRRTPQQLVPHADLPRHAAGVGHDPVPLLAAGGSLLHRWPGQGPARAGPLPGRRRGDAAAVRRPGGWRSPIPAAPAPWDRPTSTAWATR